MEYLDKDSLVIVRHYKSKKIDFSIPLGSLVYGLKRDFGIQVSKSDMTIELVKNCFEKPKSNNRPTGLKIESYEVSGDLITLYLSTLQDRLFGPDAYEDDPMEEDI